MSKLGFVNQLLSGCCVDVQTSHIVKIYFSQTEHEFPGVYITPVTMIKNSLHSYLRAEIPISTDTGSGETTVSCTLHIKFKKIKEFLESFIRKLCGWKVVPVVCWTVSPVWLGETHKKWLLVILQPGQHGRKQPAMPDNCGMPMQENLK